MSYILDALKKADRERTLGEVPDLESAHWGVRRQQRSRRWPWIVVALLLFNGALLGILFSRDGGEPVAVTEETPGPAAAAVPMPAPDKHADVVVPAAQPPAQEPASQPVVQEPVQKPPLTLRPKVAVQPHVAPQPAVTAPPVAKQAPAPAARVVQAQEPLTGQAGATESALPEWSELPLEFRSRFALPRIDVHVYSDEPQRRFILVNLKKYREGDTLESGAVLEAIQPRSIHLSYQGTRFRVDR